MGTEAAASTEPRSRTGSLLREFAKVVAVEERDLSNSTDRLIQAADEVTAHISFVTAIIPLWFTMVWMRLVLFEVGDADIDDDGIQHFS